MTLTISKGVKGEFDNAEQVAEWRRQGTTKLSIDIRRATAKDILTIYNHFPSPIHAPIANLRLRAQNLKMQIKVSSAERTLCIPTILSKTRHSGPLPSNFTIQPKFLSYKQDAAIQAKGRHYEIMLEVEAWRGEVKKIQSTVGTVELLHVGVKEGMDGLASDLDDLRKAPLKTLYLRLEENLEGYAACSFSNLLSLTFANMVHLYMLIDCEGISTRSPNS